jgi:cephalosporin hydroxylase
VTRKEFDILCNTCAYNTSESPEHEKWTFWQWMQQDQNEFWFMMEHVNKITPVPKRILEIGSAHGAGLIFWDRMVGSGGQVVSINSTGPPHPHQWTMDYSTCTSDMHFIAASSHDQVSLERVKSIFTGPIDFIFIDGDHHYEGVKQDFEMYSPLVRKGGLVGFHDTIYGDGPGLVPSDQKVGDYFNDLDKPKEKISLHHGTGVVFL